MTNTARKNTSVMKRFSDVARIVTGKTPATSNRLFFGGHIPFVTPGDLDGEDPIVATKTQLTVEGAGEVNQLPEGSVLVSCIGSLGKIGIAGVNVCTNQQINALVFDKTLVEPRYGYHFCKTLRPYLEGIAPATTLPIINKSRFSEIEMPLPPLPEQRRIASILDKADALCAKRRETIAKLDQLLQSVFLEMFGDPVTNPKDWPMVSFGSVTDSRLGKMLDKRTSQGEHMKPYLANLNVQWGRFELDSLRSMHFSSKDQEEFSLRSGDLLMCEGGQPGRCAIWKEQLTDCYYQKALHRIRCHQEKCVPEYIQWMFWFFTQAHAFSSAISSATIAHLPGIKLKKMLIPLPPIKQQITFASLVQSIEKNAALHLSAEKSQKKLFSSLQKMAFEGSVNV